MTDMTLGQLADKTGKSYDTVYRYVRRNFPDIGWTKDTEVPPDIAAVLSGKKGRTKAAAKPEPQPDKQPTKKTDSAPRKKMDISELRKSSLPYILAGLVVAHAVLIWLDCIILWGLPGVIGGGMSFLIALAAVMFSFDSSMPRTSETALWVVFCVDVAAWFVHFPTFKASAAHVGDLHTGFISGFICLFSFAALYMLRDSKLD